jgi:hypothetical protein
VGRLDGAAQHPLRRIDGVTATTPSPSWTLDDLAEDWPDVPFEPIDLPVEWRGIRIQHAWHDDGVVIVDQVFTESELAAYERAWMAVNGYRSDPDGFIDRKWPHGPECWRSPGGWPYATPYMDVPELTELCCSPRLAAILEVLLGEPAGVHLNLTGWVSTRRNWHTDQYLNEPFVGPAYAAVWVALEDIHPDSGPFEYHPGSHRWFRPISQAKMRAALGDDGAGPDWPTHSERILTPLFEQAVAERGIAAPQRFLAKRGDVLIWHGRLLHRGSTPVDPTMSRRALISHYSGIHHRPDMPPAVRHERGGWYFPLGGRQPVVQP